MGVARATWYRRQTPPARVTDPIPQKDRIQPAALSSQERQRIEDYLADEDYADLSVSQVFYRLLDDGVYIASESSWHRIARAKNLTGDRRRQATHKPAAIPELCAVRPNQVWSWDITVLQSIDRGRNFKLYVILDVFSRYVVGWRLEPAENAILAVEMLTETLTAEQADLEVLHADRGSAMTSDIMTHTLKQLRIIQSHSRPRVSNDNPFSESQFKTMKYALDYPGKFENIEHARTWTAAFIDTYNTQHRHSGIGHYTPESVHDGTWTVFQQRRQNVLDNAWRQHPNRHRRRPRASTIHAESWINNPTTRQLAS